MTFLRNIKLAIVFSLFLFFAGCPGGGSPKLDDTGRIQLVDQVSEDQARVDAAKAEEDKIRREVEEKAKAEQARLQELARLQKAKTDREARAQVEEAKQRYLEQESRAKVFEMWGWAGTTVILCVASFLLGCFMVCRTFGSTAGLQAEKIE